AQCLFLGKGLNWSFFGRRGLRSKELFVGNSGGALEAAAKFAESLRAGGLSAIFVNSFELSRQFGRTAVVAGTENKIEKFFESGSVSRSAAKNRFEEANRFLCKTVAGKQIDVRKRLSNEFLRFFVDWLVHEGRDGRAARGVCLCISE